MQKRNVTGRVYWSDGTVASGQLVLFDLEDAALVGNDIVLPKQRQVTTDINGNFTAELWCSEEGQPDTLWRVTFPTGEVARFSLPAGAGSIALASLLPYPAALYPMSEEAWSRYKTAANLYSQYRPRTVYADLRPVVGSKQQQVPRGVIGVQYLAYGAEATFTEVMTAAAESATQGWCFQGGSLWLTPAPATADAIAVIWRYAHQPDELTRTFPTVPNSDLPIIDLLAQAEEAEEQQAAVESGLSSYTIGNTTVKWAQQGGAAPSGTTRAQRLRQRALAALDSPLAEWG